MDSLGGLAALPVNVEHVLHAVHTRTRSGTFHLVQEIYPWH
jgi:hypothetical protein